MTDDYTSTTGTTGRVAVAGSVTGEIDHAGDRDWFAVTLVAGTTYRIDLEGEWTGGGTLLDPYLRGIYDSEGNLIGGTTNDDDGAGGYNSRVTFTPGEGGTYYVSAGGFRSRQGTYTLSVKESPSDSNADEIGTTGTVAVDGSVTGEIDHYGDQDWFAVTLVAGTTYRIDLEGSSSRAGTLGDPFLWGIYDSEGNRIGGTTDDDDGLFYNSRIFFTPQENGTYYVSAGGSTVFHTGTYTLSVSTSSAADAVADGTGTTGTVAVDGSVTGEIDRAGDREWFAVTLEAGTAYRIDLEGSPSDAGTLSDPYLRGIYDSDGNLIGGTTDDNAGAGLNSWVTFTPREGGTYYVSASGNGVHTGTYTLSVSELPSDPHTAWTDTTGRVAVDGSVRGEIDHAGDRDWFAVTLEAGTTYRIDLEGSPSGAGRLSDPYLRGIYDSEGNLIGGTTNDDGGAGHNSRVTFTPTQAGTYYVSAGAWSDREGTYRLRVRDVTGEIADDLPTGTGTTGTVPAADVAAGTGTTGRVAVDGSVRGEIDHGGDRDWFAVTLEADTAYRIDLEGSPSGAGTLSDPYLRGIYDSDGNLIGGTTDDHSGAGLNSRMSFTPGEDGTYYVSAGANGHYTGTYTLSVSELPSDPHTAGTGTTGRVAVDGSVTGEIDHADDRDWFAVTLEAGTTYRIDLEGSPSGAGRLSDPYLRGIYDSDGNLIGGTTNDDLGAGYNSQVTFTPGEGGTYYVSAAGHGSHHTGTYTLSVTNGSAADAVTAGIDTTGRVAVDGSVRGEIDHGGDRDWFAVTLGAGTPYRIDLRGSPSGAGTLRDPSLWGIYDSDGNLIDGTDDGDSGRGYNSRVTFTPGEGGTYYVSAAAYGNHTGTYTLSVEEVM